MQNYKSRDETKTASTSGRSGQSSSPKEGLTSAQDSRDEKLHSLFDELDSDHSGKIEPEELQEALQRMGLPHNSDDYLKALMNQFDTDHDNKIDFEDFKAYASRKEDVIARSFAQLDIDHNGSISVNDLESALKSRWLPIDHEDATRMIHLLDRDCNGMVSYEEFRSFAYLLPESQVNETEILQSWVDSADWMEGIEYHVASVPPKSGFSRFVAGGLAGGFSKSVVAPMERLRIMMMADSQNKSFHKTAAKMWRDGGLAGMFRGNLTTVLKILPQTATQFAVYDTIQESMIGKLKDNNLEATSSDLSALQHAFAGALAGVAATAVTYPIETVRTQMCVCSKKNLREIMMEIGYASGTRGYFRGVKSSIANAMISNALGFTAYELAVAKYKRWTGNHSPTPTVKGVCAGVSACGIMAIVMPLENVQRRLQVQGRDGYPVIYSGSRDCTKRMYQAEGLRAFWRGSITSFLKVAPSLAAVRFAYEFAMRSQLAGGIHQYRDKKVPTQPPIHSF